MREHSSATTNERASNGIKGLRSETSGSASPLESDALAHTRDSRYRLAGDMAPITALSRLARSQSSMDVARSILQLQRSHGNRYVQRALALARQADGSGEVAPEIEASIERSRGGGKAMNSAVQGQMESAFGSDFSGVRIHTGAEAHSLNHAVGAVAFTTGRDIFFRDGAYEPGSSGGKELLAHELTHVVQQGGAPTISGVAQRIPVQRHCSSCAETGARQMKYEVSHPEDVQEIEAKNAGRAVAHLLDSAPDVSTNETITAAKNPQLSVLRKGLSLARDTGNDQATEILERSIEAVEAGHGPPESIHSGGSDFSAQSDGCSCGGHCAKCSALQRTERALEGVQRGHIFQRVLARDPAPQRRTKLQCINNALSSAGIPWAILAVLGVVCSMIGGILGLGGGPAAPATVPAGAALAAAVCIAALTGLTVGFITGVIVKCSRDPSVEWTFAQSDTQSNATGGEGATAAA